MSKTQAAWAIKNTNSAEDRKVLARLELIQPSPIGLWWDSWEYYGTNFEVHARFEQYGAFHAKSGHLNIWRADYPDGILFNTAADFLAHPIGREFMGEEQDAPKTLRDEFAMAIITGMIANGRIAGEFGRGQVAAANNSNLSITAYVMADAMMEARKTKPNEAH